MEDFVVSEIWEKAAMYHEDWAWPIPFPLVNISVFYRCVGLHLDTDVDHHSTRPFCGDSLSSPDSNADENLHSSHRSDQPACHAFHSSLHHLC